MHPYRVIVRTHRWSDIISTIPDIPNTPPCQFSGTDDTPQGPASRPHYMESCPGMAHIYDLPRSGRSHDYREHSSAASRARPPLCQLSGASSIISIGSSTRTVVFGLIRLDSTYLFRLDLTHGF